MSTKHSILIQIDDKELDQDRDRNVRLVYEIHQAAEKDLLASPMGAEAKMNRSELQRRYFQSYPETKNKTPFDTAYRYIGIKDHGKKGTPTRIKGADVYRIVRFLLVNMYPFGWNNVKTVLKDAGHPYDKLLALEKSVSPEDKVARLSNQKVGDLLSSDTDPAARLRKLADEFDLLNGYLRQSNTNNRILMEENNSIRRQVKATRTLINRLLNKLATEKDEKKRTKLVETITEENKKLDDLIND